MIFLASTVHVLMIFCKIYFFAVTAALCAPLLLHIPRLQDHQRWGKNFFGHFFLGQEIGSEFFFPLLGIFLTVVIRLMMRGTTSFKKINLTFSLGAGECISAQQSPTRHISRRGREGAGLLIS